MCPPQGRQSVDGDDTGPAGNRPPGRETGARALVRFVATTLISGNQGLRELGGVGKKQGSPGRSRTAFLAQTLDLDRMDVGGWGRFVTENT